MSRWIGLPVLGFILLALVVTALPGSDCDPYTDESRVVAVALFVLMVVLALACLAGAALRIRALRAGPGISRRALLTALGGIAVLALLSVVMDLGEDVDYIWRAFLVAGGATGGALLVLLVAAIARRGPDDVSLLLPFYLAGTALTVYPALVLIAIALDSGVAC